MTADGGWAAASRGARAGSSALVAARRSTASSQRCTREGVHTRPFGRAPLGSFTNAAGLISSRPLANCVVECGAQRGSDPLAVGVTVGHISSAFRDVRDPHVGEAEVPEPRA